MPLSIRRLSRMAASAPWPGLSTTTYSAIRYWNSTGAAATRKMSPLISSAGVMAETI